MKKINKIVVIALALTTVIAIPSNAIAEEKTLYCQGMVCSETPPAPESFATFALVDADGTVKGQINCSIAHCPSSVNGTVNNCVNCGLIQLTAPGVMVGNAGTPENPVKYNSQLQAFTQGSVETPTAVTQTETVDTATISTTIYSDVIIFGPNIPVTPIVTATTGATLSAIQGLATEVIVFETPKTRSQIQASIENKLKIMQQYLNRFYVLLNGWLID
jgi:hypothetical protein